MQGVVEGGEGDGKVGNNQRRSGLPPPYPRLVSFRLAGGTVSGVAGRGGGRQAVR
jgi:hypothetical protein